jgi:hypothetical protein
MKKILAIGGAVIKTARKELAQIIQDDEIEMLIHNGGSLYHDFQLAVDPPPAKQHSYPIDYLMEDRKVLQLTNNRIKSWFYSMTENTPNNTITYLCYQMDIPVLMFTGLGCDWWQFSMSDWTRIAIQARSHFNYLVDRFKKDPFHYVCMGSAVIHPEVFIKALALSGVHRESAWFTADVVDFKQMYRPETRVAKYGFYYKMTHKEFLTKWKQKGLVKFQ